MTESIIVHFLDSEPDEIKSLFENDVLSIYPYDDIDNEYSSDEIEILKQKLGGMPYCSFSFEFKRSKQNEACELTKKILKETLSHLTFVVDDDLDNIWSQNEIKQRNDEFLAFYYYGNQMKNKLYGSLLGGATGDALGLPYEGLSKQRAQRFFKDKRAFNLIPFAHLGMVSDDTEHAVMTVQAWIGSRHEDAETAHRRFRMRLRHHLRLWLLGLPAGIGLATGKALFKLWAFLPNSGVFSAGNGPAMRASVLGVLIDDVETLKRYIHTTTVISHTDPKAEQGALTVALCAHYFAYHSREDEAIVPELLFKFIREHLSDAELLGYLQSAYDAVNNGALSLSDWMHETFGVESVGGYMYHTVPAVFFVIAKYPKDPMRGLETLINTGGDVDTTCAIAGGIWGVKYGETMLGACKGRIAEPKLTPKFMRQLSEQAEMTTQSQNAQRPKSFGGVMTLIRNLLFLMIVLTHGFRRLLPPY